MAEVVNKKVQQRSEDFRDSIRTHDVHQFLDNVKEIRPLGDRIILKSKGGMVGTETKSGIVLPDSTANPVKIGEVVAVSHGWFYKDEKTGEKKFFEIDLKKGDKVVFYFFGANPLHIGGEKFLICGYSEILGLYEEK